LKFAKIGDYTRPRRTNNEIRSRTSVTDTATRNWI